MKNTAQEWYDKGFDAFGAGRSTGRSKMMAWDEVASQFTLTTATFGAKYFNEGWREAERQQRWDEEREAQNKIAEELEGVKMLICNGGDELDLDALVDVLHSVGVRA